MNKKVLIVSLIIILIICLLIIVISVVKYNGNTSENIYETNETNPDNVNENTNNLNETDEKANTELNTNNSDDTEDANESKNNDSYTENVTEDDDYVFYNEGETGMAQYSRDQLNNFELNLNISEEAMQYIKDYDEFYITIKEYIYKHGLVDADTAEMEKYQLDQSNNRVGIVFKLNNDDEDKFLAIFYLNTETTEVYNY